MPTLQEAPWQEIARRKQAACFQALHEPSSISITVPTHLLPHDPPSPKHGPQPVHHIPSELLTPKDLTLTSLSIPDLLSAIRNGTYTATTVTSAFIRRASITHQLTNCLTEPLFTRALARAALLDRDYQNSSGKGPLLGPLHGLPVSIKDGFNIAGYDSSIGLATLCFKPATGNAPLVDLLESLGCIIIAKTNIPQTLASLDSVNNVFGRTYNPFNRLLTAGGSSGGEGVLVAMRGSAIGFGTDIGGSIRVPAMCNGVYGFKPSVGRIPYGGQISTGLDGMSRSSVQAVAGPIGRSMEDIEVVTREVVPRGYLFGEDCVSWDAGKLWMGVPLARDPGTAGQRFRGSGSGGEFVIGVLRGDGNCQLLPPIARVMDEVSHALRVAGTKLNVRVVDLETPKAWTKAQSVMSKLMGVDGGAEMSRMLLETQEPLVPWMSTRFKHGGKMQKLERVAEIQAQRAQLEREILRDIWKVSTDEFGRKRRGVDAIICPLAPHPVPEIERYNAVGYTSSWVLFDYPAGSVPIREVKESDLELGKPLDTSLNVLGSWDEKNRELWDENKTNRKVYLNSMLSVQCVTSRLEDEKLAYVMALVDEAVKRTEAKVAKL